jgi:hypothetical protein
MDFVYLGLLLGLAGATALLVRLIDSLRISREERP